MDIEDEELCLLSSGNFVNIVEGCDSFDEDDISIYFGNPMRRTCWGKDLKGFHPCSINETDYVQIVNYGNNTYSEVNRNFKSMKYESGVWRHSEDSNRIILVSDTMFWGYTVYYAVNNFIISHFIL